MGFEIMPIDFFKNVAKNMPNNVRFFLWKADKKIVAFLFALISEDSILDYYIGLDYSVAHEYSLYFIKFRDTIKWCIDNKIKKYEMGTTGYEPKKRLGFDFIPVYLYAKLRNRVFRPVFKILCRFLQFENFDPILKEMKKARAA
jgi:predicted N-acyltransferase